MKKLLTLLVLSVVLQPAYAQISHTDVSPPRVLDGRTSGNQLDSVYIHLAHPIGTNLGIDSALHIWHFDAQAPFSKDVGVDCRGNDVELLKLSNSQAPTQYAAIDSGIMISASAGTWQRPNYARLALENALDNWDSKTDKYLGVRFKRNNQWHYGWIKMSIDGTPTNCTIKGYAYETTAGQGIPAGAKGSSTTSIATSTNTNEPSIHVYNKQLLIDNVTGIKKVVIINMSGQVVYNTDTKSVNQLKIDLQTLPKQVYIVQLIGTNNNYSQYKFQL